MPIIHSASTAGSGLSKMSVMQSPVTMTPELSVYLFILRGLSDLMGALWPLLELFYRWGVLLELPICKGSLLECKIVRRFFRLKYSISLLNFHNLDLLFRATKNRSVLLCDHTSEIYRFWWAFWFCPLLMMHIYSSHELVCNFLSIHSFNKCYWTLLYILDTKEIRLTFFFF